MRRAGIALTAILLLSGCGSFESTTADLPGTLEARTTIGELICGQLARGRDVEEIAAELDGEIFTLDEALQLTEAADEHLC